MFESGGLVSHWWLSIRSLKATAVDAELRLFKTAKVHYDSELSHYGTKDGVHRDPHGERLRMQLQW